MVMHATSPAPTSNIPRPESMSPCHLSPACMGHEDVGKTREGELDKPDFARDFRLGDEASHPSQTS